MYAENSRIDGGEREMCEMFDLLGLVLDGESVYCFFFIHGFTSSSWSVSGSP